jgi:hypothetical protein
VTYALVIAGLRPQLFDRVKKISGKELAPGGTTIISPLSAHSRYDGKYIDKLLAATYEFAKKQGDTAPFSTLLLYADYEDNPTVDLLRAFYPFSLPLAFIRPDFENARSGPQIASVLNTFARNLVDAAIELRRISGIVAGFTNIHNLTPLLLPMSNFRSTRLQAMIDELYFNLPGSPEPKEFIASRVERFISAHPRVRPSEEDRHCFTDGHLFFKSPGRDRHGVFRNASADAHNMTCLLNARSRVGGHYPAKFHFDCVAVRAALAKDYPNCHGLRSAPGQKTHVNISPNDFIR